MLPSPPRGYNLGFTAASLRPELARILAERYLEAGSWDGVRGAILGSNALQTRSATSAERLERELRERLAMLSDAQLIILSVSTVEDRTAIAWLAVMKRYRFVYDFAAEVLRHKIETGDPVLRPSDYEGYVEDKMVEHREIVKLTDTTRGKLRRVLMRMLGEVGLIGPGRTARVIHRPVLAASVVRAIVADDARWLAGFLVPEHEIAGLRDGVR